MIECIAPRNKAEFARYYHFRWQLLREPWQQVVGSEQDELEDQAIHRMLIDENGTIFGVARLHFTYQYQAQIRYMAISQSEQGKGLGKKLVAELEFQAMLRGAQTVLLNAREHTIKFYQKMGYQLGAISHVLYDEITHFSMEKNLGKLYKSKNKSIKKLQDTWYQTIPISKAMNIAICYYDEMSMITHCDPAFNKNLHNTMFAGSIYTLATLTGWGWVYFHLLNNNAQGDIVLANASIKYIAPIKGVVAAKTTRQLVVGETKPLQQSKKARFTVEVELLSGEKVAARFTGHYVVIPKNTC